MQSELGRYSIDRAVQTQVGSQTKVSMYGFPFFDETGKYGISSRDNYIISEKDYTFQKLKLIQKFLSTKPNPYKNVKHGKCSSCIEVSL